MSLVIEDLKIGDTVLWRHWTMGWGEITIKTNEDLDFLKKDCTEHPDNYKSKP